MGDGLTSLPVEALLRPRSLAFVGVSPAGGAGAKMLRSAREAGFTGRLWPVNSKAAEIQGLRCYPTLAEVPETPDCAVIAVPAPAVLEVLRDAADKGIKAAVVVSEGFADEQSEEGRARQRDLVAFARARGLVVAGPNCMGVASLHYRSAATMADIPNGLESGGISLVSQSGGLLNSVAELCNNRGIGLNYLISNGNGAVLQVADYIEYLATDQPTRVIACIMEGVPDGRRFREVIARAAAQKPIVILKLGRSAVAQQASLAHTGTLAGQHEVYEALFRQNGVALVDSIDALVETAALFDVAPLPRGDGVCMFTVSGGATSMIADLGEAAGLRFPPIGARTNTRLQRILGVDRRCSNPIDTVGMPRLRKNTNMTAVLQALIDDDDFNVIGLVLGMRADGAESHQTLIDQMAALSQQGIDKPMMVVSFMSTGSSKLWRGFARKYGFALLDNLDRGMKAVRCLIDYATYRRRGESNEPVGPMLNDLSLPPVPPGKTLTEEESKKLLALAGLPVTHEALARSEQEAIDLAARMEGSVALKVQSPDIPHKSDVGGVFLGVRGANEVARGYRQILENAKRACPDADIRGVLVQEVVEAGPEFILGMTYDPHFGPIVVIGAGGVAVEIFKDAAVGVPPLTRSDVMRMINSLKAARLLQGFRGEPPADTEALIHCCQRFAAFVAATDGQFAAIDLNPVIVLRRGHGVRIADALIVPRAARERNNGHVAT